MEIAMRNLALGIVLVVAAASAPRAQDIQRPRLLPPELMVAPIAPKVAPEPTADGGKPADICRELVAFLEQRTAAGRATGPAPPTSAQDASAPPRAEQQPGKSASVPPGSAESSAPPPAIDKPQHTSGLLAPIPPDNVGGKPPPVPLDQVRASMAANDVRACQQAARQIRRAGVAMPDGLLALAALRPELLETGQFGRGKQ
jgi:hypothetical protein